MIKGHSSHTSSDKIVTAEPREAVVISSDNMSISDDAQKLLWLPTEYRPASAAVSGSVGTESGKVWICRLE